MKVTKQTFDRIKSDMEKMLLSINSKDSFAISCLRDVNAKPRLAWHLWQRVYDDRKNTDEHPTFKNGLRTRVLEYVEGFEIYPDGTNDKTLQTALNKALDDILKDDIARLKAQNINL